MAVVSRPRRPRLGLLLGAGAAAALLLGTSLWNLRGIQEERRHLHAAQADVLFGILGPCLRDGTPEACLEEARDQGARWVALLSPGRGLAAQAGSPLAPPEDRPPRDTRVTLLATGGVRASAPQRPRRPPEAPPELRGVEPGPGALPPPEPAPPELLLVDFEPIYADTLEARARATALFAGLGAAGILVGAALLRRRMQRADEAERELAEGRRLATLGTMSAVLAHEIRNPVAVLLGHAQLLAEELPNEQTRHMVEGAARLDALTRGLLEFVRTGELRREPTDPVAPARAAAALDPARVALELQGPPPAWPLDGARVEQALQNLVRNALDAGPGPVLLRVGAAEGGLRYEVEDAGPGIDPALLPEVFEPFVTGRAQGTGLGLAVVRRIAEAHGGAARAENRPQGGARFTLDLPEVPDGPRPRR